MEEKNIFWGEIAGGVLIVGCSIALVVTLWRSLEAIPYSPFLLSAGVTAALFAAGQYTLHHWKLAGTSRGLLVIALLLAPLNLLLLADTVTRGPTTGPLAAGLKLASVLAFAGMVRTGGRDLLLARSGWRTWLAVAVVGAPATQLLPAAWLGGLPPIASALLPWAFFALGCAAILRGSRTPGGSAGPAAPAVLEFVGLAAFALLAAWGLHVARSPDIVAGIHALALPLALAAVPVVEAGLFVHRRGAGSGGFRVAGTAVALAGFAAMTGAPAAGWPDPLSVLLVAAAAGVFLTRVALRDSLPWAQAGAIPALALAAVVGYQGAAGRWADPLAASVAAPSSGAVLAGLALVLAAVAEVFTRRRSFAHARSYAVGALGTGIAALFVAWVTGVQAPAPAAVVHFACAAGLLAANFGWWTRTLASGGLWLLLVGSVWTLHALAPNRLDLWGFVVALESQAFAALSLGLRGSRDVAVTQLRRAGRDVAFAAAVLSPAVAVFATGFPISAYHTGTLFALTAAGLVLARLTGRPVVTWLASGAAFLGFVHLTTTSLDWVPAGRAVVVGVLSHATLATVAALALRRSGRVFADPLRWSAQVAAVLALPLLAVPPASLTAEWAGFAAWNALVWLTFALVWRTRGAFPTFQGVLSLAAVLLGVALWNTRGGLAAGGFAYWQPAALHVYAVALGVLGLGWTAARRAVRHDPTARVLWTGRPLSVDRVVLGGLVLGQLILAVLAIQPECRAELTAVGAYYNRVEPAELAQAFGGGAWVVLGLLAVAVLASFRFTAAEGETDVHLIGLALLLLTAPVVWAGSHAADVAAATALRWGLAAAFVAGSALIAARVPLRRARGAAGIPVSPSPAAKPVLLAAFAVAAGVVVLISAQAAGIGLSGHKPVGPSADSAFAAMGATAANLVPLALVVLGLAGTAWRERSPGYAFAGGQVFTAAAAAGYALDVVTGGELLGPGGQVIAGLIAAGAAAVWALLWLAAGGRVGGGPLLTAQAWLGLAGLACGAVVPAVQFVVKPEYTSDGAALAFGRYGGVALVLAALAARLAARKRSDVRFHATALTAVVAGVVFACTAQQWQGADAWASFHALAAGWGVVGLGVVVAARRASPYTGWLDGLAVALTVLALRGGWDDPAKPWPSVALAVVAAVVAGAAARVARGTVRMVASALPVNLAAVFLWVSFGPDTTTAFLLANAAGIRPRRGQTSCRWRAVPRWSCSGVGRCHCSTAGVTTRRG